MRLQALRKEGVELQSDPEDADVTREKSGVYDGRTEVEAKSAADERDVGLVDEKELDGNLGDPNDEQKDVEPVDNTIADESITHVDRVDNQVRDTGLRTVRSLVNGGLAILALGALSPIGLILKHLNTLKEEGQDVEGEERTEDDNDL